MPIIILFITPFTCSAMYFEVSRQRRRFSDVSCPAKFMISILTITGFFFGMVASIVTVPLIIVIGIPMVIFSMIRDRIRHHRTAD